eukprot:6214279-Pleurochrysis_carterae.AAC.2
MTPPWIRSVLQACLTSPKQQKPATCRRALIVSQTLVVLLYPLVGDLLRATCRRLRDAEAPKQIAAYESKATLCVDGWDEIFEEHMVKMLVGTTKGYIYHSTVDLLPPQSMHAHGVAQVLIRGVKHAGKMSIVQVCMGTCPVMSAAWRLVEAKFPWVTTSCCASHNFLRLELQEFARILAW